MKNKFIAIFATLLALSLTACGHRDFVRGGYDENVEEANLLNDKWSESDMQKATKDLVDSALKHDAIANAKRPPIVMVTKLQNKTSEHIDTQSITDMLTVELQGSGKVQFVDKAAREDIAEEYDYQGGGSVSRESQKKKGNQVGADLILNGRIDSIVQQAGSDKSVYYKITLNMTNLSTGLIVWTNHKQIRKTYKKQRVGL